MSIFLSQHGKSASKDVDPQRGLTRDGTTEVKRVANILSESGLTLDVIWHSGKARASQTAELFAASLKPIEGVKSRDDIDPLDDVVALAEHLPKDRNEMYVGHLPFMERVVSYLINGNADNRVIQFQNSGVVRLDWQGEGERWIISWTVFPNL